MSYRCSCIFSLKLLEGENMSRHPSKVKNVFNEVIKDGVICIEFITGGKNEVSVKLIKNHGMNIFVIFTGQHRKKAAILR
jgi:hypothetical protein